MRTGIEDVRQRIAAYYDRVAADPHHRYRSWEHCYAFFTSKSREDLRADPHAAALHLGFYLASWGMYRGSSFLLSHTYTVHEGVMANLTAPRFAALWDAQIGSNASDTRL